MSGATICPHCTGRRSEVLRSWAVAAGQRRERQCFDCKKFYFTDEVSVERPDAHLDLLAAENTRLLEAIRTLEMVLGRHRVLLEAKPC